MQWTSGLTSNHDVPALCATKVIDWVLSHDGTARYVNSGEDHPLRYADELYRHGPASPDRLRGVRAVAKDAPAFLVIETLGGPHRANPGDWIIRGVQGEFYPCKPDIFEATYEPTDTAPRATATVLVKVIPDGDDLTGPVLGTVYVMTPAPNEKAVRLAVEKALRVPEGAA
jgi:hypothetical protein